ncbi:MAG: hypothetical protein K9K66_14135 [Desulfarculaceae bacterium]|nr:hypothetical protein [Desulfarculaceae bacterium]MCF8073811.1 hypothetical protein [Desulfarculaceae bacterium]MCF8102791.1 hypothetical protein [Desulfarculaceae bacterium]MCF8116235.1 hypothetical protein [Desulfarculaceae bacterium]
MVAKEFLEVRRRVSDERLELVRISSAVEKAVNEIKNEIKTSLPIYYSANQCAIDINGYHVWNEYENAIDYLESAINAFSRPDKTKWKWISINLFSALYCYLVILIYECGGEEKVLEEKRAGTRRWQELIGFSKALECVKNPENLTVVTDDLRYFYLELSEEEEVAIQEIRQSFRNNFIHFVPGVGQFLSPAYALMICSRVIRPLCSVISVLFFSGQSYQRLSDPAQICRTPS